MRIQAADRLMSLLSAGSWGDPVRSFLYTSHRLQDCAQCPAQPALYLVQRDERQSQRTGMGSIRDVEFWAVVYQSAGSDSSHPRPSIENDLILETIESALREDSPDGRCTLGGLVHHARIEGTIVKDSGDTDGQGVMMIPIWVMLP